MSTMQGLPSRLNPSRVVLRPKEQRCGRPLPPRLSQNRTCGPRIRLFALVRQKASDGWPDAPARDTRKSFVELHHAKPVVRHPSAKDAVMLREGLAVDPGGALDGGGVEALAGRQGAGSRHLSRLLPDHVGASPIQVAQTMRVQRAKRILDET
jgi:AraC-like DNA-binding protein